MSKAISTEEFGGEHPQGQSEEGTGATQAVDGSGPLERVGVVSYHFSLGNMSLARSLLTEADAGHTEFTDEVYQNESRYPGGEWKAAEDTYTDAVSGVLPR